MAHQRVAIVHEWLTNLAGSEKVVAALRGTFADAPVWTSMRWGEPFATWAQVNTSFLQWWANGANAHVKVLPLMPAAFSSLRLPANLDLVITSFHSFALYCRVPRSTRHIVYCHTPPRFLWSPRQLAAERGANIGRALAPARVALRGIDRRRGARPDVMIANSGTVRRRIAQAYGRSAPVIYPPVDIDRFTAVARPSPEDYFLVVSRLVPYKQVSLAVEAFNQLGWPLVVLGGGRQERELRAQAHANVRFLGHVDDAALPSIVAGARALIMPGEEDFGITPVEAMACGVPVVAYGRGGATETVTPGLSGIFFADQDAASLIRAVRAVAAEAWDRTAIAASVSRFHETRFRQEIRQVADSLLA